MSSATPVIVSTGLVSAVGLTAKAGCAAIRAQISTASNTRFIDSRQEWIVGHTAALEAPRSGLGRLAEMAALAAEEALRNIPRPSWGAIPVLLCIAEPERPNRLAGLDHDLQAILEERLGVDFHPGSHVVAHGRVSVAFAMTKAREMLRELPHVLVVGADSLLDWPTLAYFERVSRLLTEENSDGFIPGEGGGALLLARSCERDALHCVGIGFGKEGAHIDSGKPLRADGLTQAVKAALAEALWDMHDVDCRITDLSGEQYYFKEAALTLTRTLRRRKEDLDLWHPAQCIGESGALAGIASVVVADAAAQNGYAKGRGSLIHLSNDNGERAALLLHFRSHQ